MALLKISRGPTSSAGTLPQGTTEGFAYFQPYNGAFWIDIATADTAVLGYSTQEALSGSGSPNRIKIAAGVADKLAKTLTFDIRHAQGAAPASGQNTVTFNGSDDKTISTKTINALNLAGGVMTGRIDRYYSATSTDPLLRVSANNKDCYLFEIGHGTSAGTVSGNSYVLEYHGSGSSPENTLRLLTRASNAYAEAVKVNENGIVTFAKQIVGIIDTAAATEHDLKFSDVKTAGAAAPAAGSYVTFNGEENITISTQTIGALNLNGDTMLGRLTTEKPIN